MAKTKTDPIYVNSITSNLKSPDGGKYKLDLGPKTLLLGGNTSHKSAVLQSVELALTGAADDVVGRNVVKDASLLLSLVKGNELVVEASVSDESAATFKLNSGKKANLDSDNVNALVLRQVRDALSSSTAVARKAFLSWAAGSISRTDILANFPTMFHAKYDDIADKQRGSEIARLLAVTDYAAKQQRGAAKEIKGAQQVLDVGMGNVTGGRPTEPDVDDARQAVASAQRALEASLTSTTGVDRSAASAQLVSAQSALVQWEEGLLELDKAIAESQPDPTVQQAVGILTWATDRHRDTCPICSSEVGLMHLIECKVAYEKATAPPPTQLLEQRSSAVEAVTGWGKEVMRLEAILSTTSAAPTSSAISTDEARAQLAAARTHLTDLERTLTHWISLARARDVVATMKANLDTYKDLKKICEQTVGALLDSRSASFAQRVQAYLPKTWVFGIELRDGKKEVFRMGLRRGDDLHCALSGAEWAAVTTAIAAAIKEIESQKKLSVLIPEDRAWDGKTLAKVMRALSAFPGQVLMASTTKPTGKKPAGWTIIEMDDFSEVINVTGTGTDPADTTDTQADTTDAPVTKPSTKSLHRILAGLGYDDDQIGRMSQDTAAEIIRKGHFATNVCVLRDGDFQVTADNIVAMPPR